MGKKKKRRKVRRTPPKAQQTRRGSKRRQERRWWIPLLAGAVGLVVLVLGGSALLDALFPRDKPEWRRTVRHTETEPRKPVPTPKPAPAKKTTGLLARLPGGQADALFSDSDLADKFEKARDDLIAGKPPMPARRELERVLAAMSSGDVGRQHVLAAAAYASLKTRDGEAAARYLQMLTQDFPDNPYGELVDVMSLDARILKEARNQRSGNLDEDEVRAVLEQARGLAGSGLDREVGAYAQLVVGKALGLLEEHEAAAQAYLKVADTYPDSDQAPVALLRAADMFRKDGQIDRAISTLERLVAAFPREKTAKDARKTLRELRLIGKPAPDLRVEDWVNGQPSPLSELKGKVVLLAFWQTWCPHCREELPRLAELYEQYKDQGLVVVGATKNDRRQDEAKLAQFLEDHPLPFPVARVNPRSSSDYAVTGVPAGVLIDRKGIIRDRAHPTTFTPERIEALLAEE